MKLGKKIINKRNLLVVGVLTVAMFTFAGCGRADISITAYDKENGQVYTSNIAVEPDSKDENNTNSNETNNEKKNETTSNEKEQKKQEVTTRDVANEAIRNALKNNSWLIEKGIYQEIFGEDYHYYPTFRIIKINDVDGMPAYLVTSYIMDAEWAYIVTYKNGDVYASSSYAGSDYTKIYVDVKNNIVKALNMSADYTTIYKMENGEFKRIVEYETEEESLKKYPAERFEDVTIEMTEKNIDKYVK